MKLEIEGSSSTIKIRILKLGYDIHSKIQKAINLHHPDY